MENPIKMDDLGVPLFSETSMYIYDLSYHWLHLIRPAITPLLLAGGGMLGGQVEQP